MTNEQAVVNACRAMGNAPYQCKSSYPDGDAQRNLESRTHYADPDTLKFFKARILRGTHSKNGLFYLLQESLPHPEHNGRVRRNVLFDVFGSVVGGREVFHKTAVKADTEYSELRRWMDDPANVATVEKALRERIAAERKQSDEALRLLEGGVV